MSGYDGARNFIAYTRDTVTTSIRQVQASGRAWLLDVTSSDERPGRRSASVPAALLTLLLAALLLLPYFVVRAVLRHVFAFRFQYHRVALWYGLMSFELAWLALGGVALIWPGAAIRVGIVGAIFTTIAWVTWSNSVLTFEDDLLLPERGLKQLIYSVLHTQWWQDL